MTKRSFEEDLELLTPPDQEKEKSHLPSTWIAVLKSNQPRTVLESWIVELPLDIGPNPLYLLLTQAFVTGERFNSDFKGYVESKRHRLDTMTRVLRSSWIMASDLRTIPISGKMVLDMFFHDNTDHMERKVDALMLAATDPNMIQFRLSRHLSGYRSDMHFVKLEVCVLDSYVLDYVLNQNGSRDINHRSSDFHQCLELATHQPLLAPPTNFSEKPLESALEGFLLELWDWQKRNVNYLSRIENHRGEQLLDLSAEDISKPIPRQIGGSNVWLNIDRMSLSIGKPHFIKLSPLSIECRGGMFCDPTSTGKSITTIAAIWNQKLNRPAYSYFDTDMQRKKKANFFKSSATLIICPTRLVKQWEEYFKTCLGDRCITNRIPNKPKPRKLVVRSIWTMRDMAKLSLKDMTELVDVFIVPRNLINGKSYCHRLVDPSDLVGKANYEQQLARHNADLKTARGLARAPIRSRITDLETGVVYTQDWKEASMAWVHNSVQMVRAATTRSANRVSRRDITSFPFEAIFWERKIIDEAHEIVSNMSRKNALAFSRIEANFSWLLTATPQFKVIDEKETSKDGKPTLSQLLNIQVTNHRNHRVEDHIHHVEQNVWTLDAFLRSWCRKSGAIEKKPVTEHHIQVTLTPQELALYHSRQDTVANLLQFCSYHNELQNATDTQSVYSVSETTTILESERKEKHKKLQSSIDILSKSIATVWDDFSGLVGHIYPGFQPELEKNAQTKGRLVGILKAEAEAGTGDGHLKELIVRAQQLHELDGEQKTKLRQLQAIKRQQAYYESIIKLLANDEALICPIHFAEIPAERTMLLSCGHYFCEGCLQACWKGHSSLTCPACRCAINKNKDMRIVDRRPPVDTPVEELAPNLSDKYGSKINSLVATIRKIREDPEQGKILVFARWDHLLKQIGAALNTFDIKTAFPRGNISQINAAFNNFYTDNDVRVLLLSTKHNLSGSHLVEANNLIFVHPFPEAPEVAIKEWEQAVSRMQRYGQQRDLHIWYMITNNTIEVDLASQFTLYKAAEDQRQKNEQEIHEVIDSEV